MRWQWEAGTKLIYVYTIVGIVAFVYEIAEWVAEPVNITNHPCGDIVVLSCCFSLTWLWERDVSHRGVF